MRDQPSPDGVIDEMIQHYLSGLSLVTVGTRVGLRLIFDTLSSVKAQHMGYDSPGHYRVRFDYVDRFGKVTLRWAGALHHLGIGIEHRGRKLMMLVDEVEVRVIDDVSGEIISTHLIKPEKNYWARTS